MKKIYFIPVSLFLSICSFAQIYSFENPSVPEEFSPQGGSNLSVASNKYKLGTKSLRWDWVKGSSLIIDNPDNLNVASRNSSGGISLYVYNTQKSSDALQFLLLNNKGEVKCQKEYRLQFEGWRSFWCSFTADMGHNREPLSQLQIKAPQEGESGTIYFDFLEFPKTMSWARMSDLQYTVKQSSQQENFLEAYKKELPSLTKQASPDELAALLLIKKRIDQWFLGTDSFNENPLLNSRKVKIKEWITKANKDYPKLSHAEDGTITGPGLFPMTYPIKVENEKPLLFKDFSSDFMIPLAYDFRLNGSKEAANRLIDMYDWFYDQGWAAGSSLGTLYMEKLRSGGYFQSLFLARDILDEERLNREIDALKWFSLFGSAIERVNPGETADNFRSLLMPKLYYALIQPNNTKQVAAMREFHAYCEKAFEPVEGFIGTFKPDLMGYHHQTAYLAAYYPTALYTASWIAYLLYDTPYALSDNTLQFLKKSMLSFRDFCALYGAPAASNGRFPDQTMVMHKMLPGISFLATAMNDDKELLSMFARLWNPEESLIKEYIAAAQSDITFTTTIGEIESVLSAANLKATPEVLGNKSTFYPYGGLGVYRTNKSHLSIKGASKFIWDFEGGGHSENTLGRYLSNGMIELTDMSKLRRNPSIPEKKDANLAKIFNWNRLPGATTIELPNEELHYITGGKNKHRNFTNQTFLGGTTLDSETSLFGLSFHDITYDPSFVFQKSFFRIGDAFVCLGSTINNNNSDHRTITTLFQTEVLPEERITINGKTLQEKKQTSHNPILCDNLSTTYIVLNGDVEVETVNSNKRTITSAVINHGTQPVNGSYSYIMLPAATKKQNREWSKKKSPITIVQQDQNAHIIHHTPTNTTAINLFNTTITPAESVVKQANTPSLILYQKEGRRINLSFSDPDMRRNSGAGINDLSEKMKAEKSNDFNYELQLNGNYSCTNPPAGFTVTSAANVTLIKGNVREGRNYQFTLIHK